MHDPDPIQPDGRYLRDRTGLDRTAVAVGAIAVALLIGALAVIRSIPGEVPARVLTASFDGADPNEHADAAGTPVGAAELPHAGLVPERTEAMRAVIDAAAIGPALRAGPIPDGAFGESLDPCAERNHLLPRDLSPVTYRRGSTGCTVVSGILDDPYLGRSRPYTHDRADRVAIDRIVSLAYAWAHGAAGWSEAERRAFATDPLNQVVVDARVLRTKAGQGPAGWLPPDVAIRCAYAARFAEIADRYELTLTAEDRDIARRQCLPPP